MVDNDRFVNQKITFFVDFALQAKLEAQVNARAMLIFTTRGQGKSMASTQKEELVEKGKL